MIDVLDDEVELVVAAQEIADKVLAPQAAHTDASESVPHEALRALADLGVMGLNLPVEFGGPGVTSVAMTHMIAAIAGGCGSTASIVTAHYLATDSVLLGGTNEQKHNILPRAADGEIIGSFALTEPGAGSNPVEMTTRAVKTDDGWHLKGTKHFITNAGFADFIIVFAITDPQASHRGISAFLIKPNEVKGIEVSEPEKTMGLRGSPVYEISFDCHLPKAALLGEEGNGFKTAMKVLDRGRIEVAAMSLGIAKKALDAAVKWSSSRMINGNPISQFQGISFKLADMYARFLQAQLVTLDAARARDTGDGFTIKSACAKLVASEAAAFITDEALQVHGGYGYTRDFQLERYVREVRIFRIYEGSSEIQRTILGRELMKMVEQA